MADPFVAEVRIFPFNFAPKGWAFCNGQLMPISQNTALFSLIGTYYGGDGKSTFALPDLQGSAPLHTKDNSYFLGQSGGSETVTLLVSEIPSHTHTLSTSTRSADNLNPGNLSPGTSNNLYATMQSAGALAPQALVPVGGGLPHNNMQPYLTLNFCIALQGVFPARP